MTKSCYLLKNCVDYIVSTFTHIFHEHVLMDAHVPRGPQFPGRILSNKPSEPDSYLTVNFHLYWLDSHVSKLCFIIATVMTTIFHITLFHMLKICHQNFIYTVKKCYNIWIIHVLLNSWFLQCSALLRMQYRLRKDF